MLRYAHDEMKDYIADAIGLVGGVEPLAAIAGVTPRAVYAWKSGKRSPRAGKIARIKDHIGRLFPVNLVMGHGSQAFARAVIDYKKRVPTAHVHVKPRSVCDEGGGSYPIFGRSESPFVSEELPVWPTADGAAWTVPYVTVPPLLSDEVQEDLADFMFSISWLIGIAKAPEHLRTARMVGRCMEHTLHNDDICLVDTGDTLLQDDAVYVLQSGEDIFIKRVCRMPGGITLRCDNREMEHLDFVFSKQEAGKAMQVLGKVVWAAKKM